MVSVGGRSSALPTDTSATQFGHKKKRPRRLSNDDATARATATWHAEQ
jgi:hypothetical protein